MLDRFSLRTFYTLVKEKSFSRVGEILCLTQPAISHQINALERYLEKRLFDRIKGEVSLTPAGEILFKYAEQIITLYQEAEKDIADLSTAARGRLVIGASTTIGQYLLPTIVGRFKDLYPKIEILLTNANTKEISGQLLYNLIDLGLVEGPVVHKDILVEKFIEDELVVIVPLNHRWREGEKINIEEFKKEPIIVREAGSGTREVIKNAFDRAGIKLSSLNIKMEFGSSEAIKSAVEAGLGVAIISAWSVLKERKIGSLKIAYIDGICFKREFTLILKKNQFKTKPVETFLAFIRSSELQQVV